MEILLIGKWHSSFQMELHKKVIQQNNSFITSCLCILFSLIVWCIQFISYFRKEKHVRADALAKDKGLT